MFGAPKFPRRSLAVFALIAGAGGCSGSNPAALIPPGERVLIQQESAKDSGQGPVTVTEMLARARGETTLRPILVHVVDTAGALSIPEDEVKQLEALDPAVKSAVLSIGPSDDPSPVTAALGAPRRAKFLAQYLPPTLHLAETRYDVSLAPNTARLEFGEADRAH
jgi:hypothetical protein